MSALKGHPKGLYLIFATSTAERFSYYGMRAIFILFLTQALLFDKEAAASIYGSYTGLVYLTPLIGGYIADKYWGIRRSVFWGAMMMAVGQFLMFMSASTLDNTELAHWMMYGGLGFLILGNGCFKPTVSSLVGQLYEPGDRRLDAAYTIFYMGVNLGSFAAPLICGYLGDTGEQYRLARSGFDSNFTGDDYIAKVGESLGLIYGYEFDGIYQADDFYTNTNGQLVLKEGITDNTRYSGGVKPGVVKYKDQDGDGKITTADRTVIGNAMPKWFGGITNTLEYKGIDFSFMFQFNYGNDIYNATRLYATQSRSSRRNMLAEVADRWSPTNASNLVPSYDGYITNDVYSRFVEDGSFLRLKNITLGYTLPQKWTSKFYVSKLRVYATGQNLFCWNNYSGYDPEVNSLNDPMRPGLDWGAYPKSRVFTFGIDLQF